MESVRNHGNGVKSWKQSEIMETVSESLKLWKGLLRNYQKIYWEDWPSLYFFPFLL
jgi:hypothetical protein